MVQWRGTFYYLLSRSWSFSGSVPWHCELYKCFSVLPALRSEKVARVGWSCVFLLFEIEDQKDLEVHIFLPQCGMLELAGVGYFTFPRSVRL